VAEGGGLWGALATQLDASRVPIAVWIAILIVSWAAGVVDAIWWRERRTPDGKGLSLVKDDEICHGGLRRSRSASV